MRFECFRHIPFCRLTIYSIPQSDKNAETNVSSKEKRKRNMKIHFSSDGFVLNSISILSAQKKKRWRGILSLFRNKFSYVLKMSKKKLLFFVVDFYVLGRWALVSITSRGCQKNMNTFKRSQICQDFRFVVKLRHNKTKKFALKFGDFPS